MVKIIKCGNMKKIIFLIALMMLPMVAEKAEAQVAKAKAMLTLSFIRYVGWGENARKGDFVIGVVRDKELVNHLKTQSAGKKFGFQDVVIKEFKSWEEATDCQVIYISKNWNFNKNADAVITKVGKDTLIITEMEGAVDHGSMINFVVRDEKLKFELSKKNASYAGIQFSAKLENMTAAINL